MIVARILSDSKRVGTGSCKIANYDDGDWFPVESFDYGFSDSQDKKDDAAPGAPKPAPPSKSAPPQGGGGGGGKGEKKDKAELTIAKEVDSTSCYLMFLAMEERQSKGKSKESERKITADIHVLASVQVGDSKDRYVYASVLVHLEAVNVKNWKINASGDGRPKETVVLRYDRGAMIYMATADGKTFIQHGPKGWDQTLNKNFTDAGTFDWGPGKYEKYIPKGYITAEFK